MITSTPTPYFIVKKDTYFMLENEYYKKGKKSSWNTSTPRIHSAAEKVAKVFVFTTFLLYTLRLKELQPIMTFYDSWLDVTIEVFVKSSSTLYSV